MERPSRSLPCLFAMQYAQTVLWRSMGVEPAALIGHSMGENTALCVAGGITLEEGLSMVAKRGQLQEQAPEGGMVSILAAPADIEPYLDGDLSIGVINAPEMCVVSGPVDQLEKLQSRLDGDDIQNTRVRINVAAHSPLLEPILPQFRQHLDTFSFREPQIPIASTFSGTWLTAEQATSSEYWVDQLRNPVRFADAIELLLGSDASRVFLEVGPANVLTSLTRAQPLARDRVIVPSSRHRKEAANDRAFQLNALGRLWSADAKVDWDKYFELHVAGRIGLPGYPFEHKEHWVNPGQGGVDGQRLSTGRNAPEQWYFQRSWRAMAAPELKEKNDGDSNVLLAGSGHDVDLISEQLEKHGCSVVRVDTDADPGDARSALEEIGSRGTEAVTIVHAGGLSRPDLDEHGLDRSYFSLWELTRLLGDFEFESARVAAICTESLECIPGECVPGAISSTITGLLRVLPSEFPGMTTRYIDTDTGSLGQGGLTSSMARMIAADILHGSASISENSAETGVPQCGVVAYRKGRRYEEEFTQISGTTFDADVGDAAPVNHVMITGGLGGLGLQAAHMFVQKGCSHITLVSRNKLPARSDWPSFSKQESRVARQIRGIESLEALGTQVNVVVADVANKVALEKALDDARAVNGPVNGVLHTAGTLDDRLMLLKSRKDAEAVLAPKAVGAINVCDVVRDDPVQFILFYSSVSAYLGAQGQTDYAAANAFLDSLAADLRSQGVPATSIGWPIWKEVGMAADLASGRKGAGAGFPEFPARSRDNIYELCLSTGQWVTNEHRTNEGLAILPGTALIQLIADAAGAQSFSIRNMGLLLRSHCQMVSNLSLASDSNQKTSNPISKSLARQLHGTQKPETGRASTCRVGLSCTMRTSRGSLTSNRFRPD